MKLVSRKKLSRNSQKLIVTIETIDAIDASRNQSMSSIVNVIHLRTMFFNYQCNFQPLYETVLYFIFLNNSGIFFMVFEYEQM